MSDAAPDWSIGRLESPRADLLIFEVLRKISEPDIEWMAAIVAEAFARHEDIDMLVIMRKFEGADLGAVFDQDALAVQLRSIRKVNRYGVVGAPAWARAMIDGFSLLMPVDARTFGLDDEAAARRWVNEGPQGTKPA